MKNKCLFLQGKSHTGKSTLILQSILPFLNITTGFLTQRLMTANGDTRAFCLTPIENAHSSLARFDSGKPDIFLEYISGKWQRSDRVFCAAGIELLSAPMGKQLMVMDEIGGIELMEEPFRHKLYEVLSDDIPCLGVIKSYGNKALMQKNVNVEYEYTALYEKLRSDIETEFGGLILDADKYSRGFVKNSIKEFLDINVKIP